MQFESPASSCRVIKKFYPNLSHSLMLVTYLYVVIDLYFVLNRLITFPLGCLLTYAMNFTQICAICACVCVWSCVWLLSYYTLANVSYHTIYRDNHRRYMSQFDNYACCIKPTRSFFRSPRHKCHSFKMILQISVGTFPLINKIWTSIRPTWIILRF